MGVLNEGGGGGVGVGVGVGGEEVVEKLRRITYLGLQPVNMENWISNYQTLDAIIQTGL